MDLKYAVTRPGGHLNEPVYPGDVGYDLESCESIEIGPGEMRDVPIGIAIELPVGRWGEITHRSSGPRRMGIEVLKGTIDNGYRGELFALVKNLTEVAVRIRPGDRVAQLILYEIQRPVVKLVNLDELSDSERGSKGFGSTGTGGVLTT
jgi:dUTP pyrophosphatase